MTSSTNRASLIERLEAEDPFRISNDGMTVAELPPPGKLRNPDGPEAAALIRELVATIAKLQRRNRDRLLARSKSPAKRRAKASQ